MFVNIVKKPEATRDCPTNFGDINIRKIVISYMEAHPVHFQKIIISKIVALRKTVLSLTVHMRTRSGTIHDPSFYSNVSSSEQEFRRSVRREDDKNVEAVSVALVISVEYK